MLLPNSYYHIHRIKHQVLAGHVSFYIPIVARKSLGVCSPGPATRTPLWPSGASNGGIGGKRCWETWPLHSCFLVVVFLYLNGVFEGSFGLRLRGQRWANYSKNSSHDPFQFSLGRPVVHQTMSCKQATPKTSARSSEGFLNTHCHIIPAYPQLRVLQLRRYHMINI